jgi:hypothetical protein
MTISLALCVVLEGACACTWGHWDWRCIRIWHSRFEVDLGLSSLCLYGQAEDGIRQVSMVFHKQKHGNRNMAVPVLVTSTSVHKRPEVSSRLQLHQLNYLTLYWLLAMEVWQTKFWKWVSPRFERSEY